MKPFVLWATAGHIDHGKSALLKALTGHDPDRLPEEKARGITIDIGFAHLEAEAVTLSFIDVPGHEGFVKNMLAGVGGVEALMLVVAANESVMPQTREHLDIARLLGIRHGLVALTKAALADETMRRLAREEVAALTAGSFLERAPVVEMDSLSGEGLPELRRALEEISLKIPPRPPGGAFRMSVDRAFSVKGFGTVATGTVMRGAAREGDEVELLPMGRKVRLRGIQVHGRPAREARAGQRAALNLHGVEVQEIRRGGALAQAGIFRPTSLMDVLVRMLPGASALKPASRVHFHLAAGETVARLIPFPGEEAVPGGAFLARLRLDEPTVAASGDRFVLRRFSPLQTIGGGVVLEPHPPRGEKRAEAASFLQGAVEESEISPSALALAAVRRQRERGLAAGDLAGRLGLLKDEIPTLAVELKNHVRFLGEWFFSAEAAALMESRVTEILGKYHRANPLRRGMPREEMRRAAAPLAPTSAFDALLKDMASRGLLVHETEGLRLPSFSPSMDAGRGAAVEKIEAAFREAGLAPAPPAALLAPFGKEGDEVMRYLLREGRLLRVASDYLIHASTQTALLESLRALAARKALWSVADFKALTGLSRKHAIPLLEHLDRLGVTAREGDRRKLLP
jgi:selenocysteine-specific elongation factor